METRTKPTTRFPEVPWPDPKFYENQRGIPPEVLDSYAGLHVAFSGDGSRILASGADREEVWAQLAAAGIDSQRVVFDFV